MDESTEVDDWFARYDNPQKAVMQRVRQIILSADPRVGECIKWGTPTFTYEGNLASFNPRSKAHVSLLFHTGGQIPGAHRRLEGTGDTARTMRILDLADADAARADLDAVVKAWIAEREARRAGGKKKGTAKKGTAKKSSR
jgi:uncharacterized protein YdhG (YjbR/CyaY superfamily)